MRYAIKLAGIYLVLSAFLGLVWLAFSYPDMPVTIWEWIAIFALAIPLQLASELVGSRLWRNRATEWVEQKTSRQSVSLLRIAYGFLLLLVAFGVFYGASRAWGVLQPMLGF